MSEDANSETRAVYTGVGLTDSLRCCHNCGCSNFFVNHIGWRAKDSSLPHFIPSAVLMFLFNPGRFIKLLTVRFFSLVWLFLTLCFCLNRVWRIPALQRKEVHRFWGDPFGDWGWNRPCYWLQQRDFPSAHQPQSLFSSRWVLMQPLKSGDRWAVLS